MTKERLRSYRHIRLEREKLKKSIKDLEAVIYGPQIANYGGQPRGSALPSSLVEMTMDRHIKLLKVYKRKEESLADAMLEIERIIDACDTLEPRERTLIRLYYADGLTWEQVCVEMSYGWAQVHRIHSDALNKLKATE